ncbi:MAG: hypothetical protein R2941_24605 [Desulfobacterales bacterium]
MEEDLTKTSLYVNLGVKEYFLFDPLYEYLEQGLAGFRLSGLTFAPLTPEADGSFFSAELGLTLKREGELLRVIDPKNGRPIPTLTEAVEMNEAARRSQEQFFLSKEAEARAAQEVCRAEQAAHHAREAEIRAEEEARKAACFAAKLREMGINPDSV